jgi:hypothetical protein
MQLTVSEPGIAVRVELPREFADGVILGENDTRFIESDISDDYYYYAVWDESNWYSYKPEAPCFKPDFTEYDPNAPICIEIWSTFNGTFVNFTAPRFIRFHELRAPRFADVYNVTMTIAKTANALGYPDFATGVRQVFKVPVSERETPSRIQGYIRDGDIATNEIIKAKGVVYALDVNQGNLVVARAFVNETTGFYNLTGLYAGTYILQASAGLYLRSDGDLVAYSLTEHPFQVSIGSGSVVGLDINLLRGPQIFGTITYFNSTAFPFQVRPITENAWFQIVGVTTLNFTVEATDSQGYIYRNHNVSLDLISGDTYRIIIGEGLRFVGYPSYGTEYAGLPRTSPQGGAETYIVRAWIYGYIQEFTTPPTVTIDGRIQEVQHVDIRMNIGGLIGGRIRFFNPRTNFAESPRDAELSVLQTTTDLIFGGNVLIEVYDEDGVLRGVTIYNATLPDGKVTYATETSIPFFVLGLSEFYNRTYSGTWRVKDYGLGTPGTIGQNYRIRVYIRGYLEAREVTVLLPKGRMYNATYDMLRGGFIQVGVSSFNNRLGTRALQAEKEFILFGAPIPPRARVYFYLDSLTLGYVEKILAPGVVGVTPTSITVNFAGMNWVIREIIYFGFQPTAIPEADVRINAYTIGYVQQMPISVFVTPGTGIQTFMAILIANKVTADVPLFQDEFLFTALAEFAFTRLEVYDTASVLRGVQVVNYTAGTTLLNFTVLGFGGLPHFFYVDPSGMRHFDYGLDTGDYNVVLPEFGFTWRRHFMQTTFPPTIAFPDLQFTQGVVFRATRLAVITQGFGVLVRGFNNTVGSEVVELSWVLVEAENATSRRSTTTLDGNYTLHVPKGLYALRYSVPGYVTKEFVNIFVDWSDLLALDPSPLELSGTPFPTFEKEEGGLRIEIEILPVVDAEGSTSAYIMIARPGDETTSLQFRWKASGGTLNATTGKSVLWTLPIGTAGQKFTLECLALEGDTIVARVAITVVSQAIPEFSNVGIVLASLITFIASWAAARRSRKTRQE